jgi:hypothetical protein
MSLVDVLSSAKQQFAELTGLEPEGISGVERNGDEGGWVVDLEALELARVPDTMDVLGSYRLHVSDDGELVSLHRRRRYARGAIDDGGR